jgi:4-amino-4-deoxy-L-arabinose transferase-like glycosyltransferase
MSRGQFDAGCALAVWCVFLFIFFSLSNAKLIPYILPIVPALALLRARPGFTGRLTVALGAAVSLLAAIAILVTLNLSWETWKMAAVIAAARTALGCIGAVLALAARAWH